MNIQELNEIIDIRKEELLDKRYSFTFYKYINMYWNKYINYLKQNNLEDNQKNRNDFLNYMKDKVNIKYYNYVIHAINGLDGLEKVKPKGYTYKVYHDKKVYKHTEVNSKLINDYLESISEYNSIRTKNGKQVLVHHIIDDMEKMGIEDVTKISIKEINDIKKRYLKFDLYSQRKRYQWVLKDFIRYLYESNNIDKDYTLLFDNFKSPSRKIQSIWTKNEIEKIVDNLGNTTKVDIRNKAMALLTIRLGIRFIDVKNLCFDNINWKENRICFIQRKTNKYLELPLTEDVGTALIDYIKNSRPKVETKYIFVSYDEYNQKLSDGFSINEYLIETYKKAEVDYKSKIKKGIHTFRHSLASNMLESRIPLDIISSTLGHTNNNSTKIYLGVGYSLLKECCLDIPEVLNER